MVNALKIFSKPKCKTYEVNNYKLKIYESHITYKQDLKKKKFLEKKSIISVIPTNKNVNVKNSCELLVQ